MPILRLSISRTLGKFRSFSIASSKLRGVLPHMAAVSSFPVAPTPSARADSLSALTEETRASITCNSSSCCAQNFCSSSQTMPSSALSRSLSSLHGRGNSSRGFSSCSSARRSRAGSRAPLCSATGVAGGLATREIGGGKKGTPASFSRSHLCFLLR